MTEFQHCGVLQSGHLAFAGVSRHVSATIGVARKIVRDWVAESVRYCAENPGEYPRAKTTRELPINPVVEVRLHPVGRPDDCVAFSVSQRSNA